MAVRIERHGAVATVVIDRPERKNAVDAQTSRDLADAFRAVDADGSVRAAVLWGAGGTFCAGADLKAMGSEGSRVKPTGDGPMGPSRMLLSKPVIAAVSGYAVAGGIELALWCDLRVMEETATFGVFCRRWGVPLVDLILTGRPVGAAEAERIGLANRVVPAGQARAAAETLAGDIAAFPPHCVKSDRRSVYETWGMELADAFAREYELGKATIDSGESFEGAARFAGGAGRHGAPAS